MNTKIMMAVALVAMAAFCLAPLAESEAVYYNVDGDSVIGTENKAEYTISYSNHDYDSYADVNMSVTYSAKLVDSSGSTVSSGVSPSSGDLTNDVSATVTVTAPKTTGSYKLVVEYKPTVSYTDSEGKTVTVPSDDLKKETEFRIKVVTPITLSVTLKNDSNIDLTGYGVYFYVNGDKVDDSYTTVNLAKEGTATVTYKWVTDSSDGKYTYSVQPADSGNLVQITGLGEEYTFYIGDNSYTAWIALLVTFVVILILVLVWVYRKPVKNYGKPKSRR